MYMLDRACPPRVRFVAVQSKRFFPKGSVCMVVLSVVGAGYRPGVWVCEVRIARASVRHARDYSPVAVVRGRSGRVVWVVCGGVRSTHRDFRNRKGGTQK